MISLKTTRGFTLLEIIIILTIIVILAAVSYPIYSSFYRISSVDAAKNEVVQNLRIAREYATNSRDNSSAGIYFSGSSYVIFSGESYLARNQSFDFEFSQNDSLVFSGNLEIVFEKITGLVSSKKILYITNSETGDQVNVEVLTSGVIQ